jgi:WXG100 family type VII secretion target
MAQIIVSPEELAADGNKFTGSANQVQDLLNQVQSLVGTLQGGAWKGNRARKFYSDWGAMKPQIAKAIETLNQASQLLKSAGSAFSGVDGQG